ncbi:hypothetical protein EHS25_009931 [Saitozyma podzolica]|uniref:histone acetyltransferase n=1 Tax=Saitozyma podzolica TaxID=1890683 RepID=A0A427YI38_9TREE|nr:hypothetical protein EHS25_009931 [Saitozyma podzolica]
MPTAIQPVAGPSQPARQVIAGRQYLVRRGALPPRPANVLDTRVVKNGVREAYISFLGEDKRLDTWIRESDVGEEVVMPGLADGVAGPIVSPNTKRRIGGKDVSTPARESNVVVNAVASSSRTQEPSPSAPSTPEREHAAMTRVRNFEDVRFGEYYSPYPMPAEDNQPPSIASPFGTPNHFNGDTPSGSASRKRKTESPNGGAAPAQVKPVEKRSAPTRSASEIFAAGVGKGGEGARGRLWVCDLCFKYMRTRAGWDRHASNCDQLQPPGRRVYQRGSYTIWEVDGAQATLYCQNLSLFGKLFIDHKSVFFHVENFLFYVLCDAATSRRDQVMAFFSKEKLSYDDFNLACIVTFPPCQNRGFGKLLIEFSYYLTLHPSTRPASLSPGTPERPLSDLGLKGYTAYWVSVVLRLLRRLLVSAPPIKSSQATPLKSPAQSEGRSLRQRPVSTVGEQIGMTEHANGVAIRMMSIPSFKGQYAIALSLSDIARACHLRPDDTAFTLTELGFLQHRRPITSQPQKRKRRDDANGEGDAEQGSEAGGGQETDLGEWKGVEVVITREAVEEMWVKWRVRDKAVLEEEYVLL